MLRDLFGKRKYVSVKRDAARGDLARADAAGGAGSQASHEGAQAARVKKPPREVPDGLWTKCHGCGALLYTKELIRNLKVCEKCGYHFVLTARERLAQVVDDVQAFEEFDADLVTTDPLQFPEYQAKLEKDFKATGLRDAIVTGKGTVGGYPVVLGIMDFYFRGGSMGTVVGEKVVRAFERAIEMRLPVIMFTASGGARMQEGILSLMQMQKTAAAVELHNRAGLLYICVMTYPSMAGVFASFGSLADIHIAEPGVTVGFAGPSLIEQTIRRPVPKDLQLAETAFQNGFIDLIVRRHELKPTLVRLLALHAPRPRPAGAGGGQGARAEEAVRGEAAAGAAAGGPAGAPQDAAAQLAAAAEGGASAVAGRNGKAAARWS